MVRFVKEWIARVATYQNLARYQDSNRLSLWVCTLVEKLPFRKFLGTQLAGLTFVSAVVAPQVISAYSSHKSFNDSDVTYIEASTLTQSTYQWPVSRIGITTQYSGYHPGIDMAAPFGSPVYPIASGKVLIVIRNAWLAYGNHIVIEHTNEAKSLYAHLSQINVSEGQTVTKADKIGEIGSTGRSTGNHLHLEVYNNETTINPVDALPTLPIPTTVAAKK